MPHSRTLGLINTDHARLFDERVDSAHAFPTKAVALEKQAEIRISDPSCSPTVRKLRTTQDGGRLKFGVFVAKSCVLGRGL